MRLSRHIRSLLPWVLAPLAPIAIAEIAWRLSPPTGYWYAEAEREALRGELDVVFVGTSRVAAAIHSKVFDEESKRLGRPVHTFDAGLAGSSLRQHVLGLRNVIERMETPSRLTVFVEAPCGLPEASRTWVGPAGPYPLLSVMRSNDLLPFLTSSQPVEEKIMVTLRFASRGSLALSHREATRERVLDWWKAAGVRVARGAGLLPPAPAAPAPPEAGELEVNRLLDEEGIRLVRLRAEEDAAAAPPPPFDYGSSPVHDLVTLVRGNGGEVVFFEMPMSSLVSAPYRTPARLDERAHFEQTAREWGAQVIGPVMETRDPDFPDLLHMRDSRAPEFTRALCKAWLETP